MKLKQFGLSGSRIRKLVTTAMILLCLSFVHAQTPTWQASIKRVVLVAPQARILVLDLKTNRVLAAHHLGEAARTLAAPGSTLKPLLLYGLVAAGQWDPARRIACNRRLKVAGHSLSCPHPLAPPFDACEALAWSCNTYFASVAEALQPGELGQMLRRTGLLSATGQAHNEATASFREPQSVADIQLTTLGVSGVRVTPLELAEAYRWLALELAAHPKSEAAQVVMWGLRDSASFGMAGEAHLGGVAVAGKTGTAEDADSSRTHGWFVGLAPASKPQVVVVVFMPSGRGADAAHLAGVLLENMPMERR